MIERRAVLSAKFYGVSQKRKDVIITSSKLHPTHPIRLKGKLSNRRTNAQTNEKKQGINKLTKEQIRR